MQSSSLVACVSICFFGLGLATKALGIFLTQREMRRCIEVVGFHVLTKKLNLMAMIPELYVYNHFFQKPGKQLGFSIFKSIFTL